MIAVIRRLRKSRYLGYAWFSLIVAATVAAGFFAQTQGLVQSVLSLIAIFWVWRRASAGREGVLLWYAFAFVCAGVIIRTIPGGYAMLVSNASIAQGLLFVIASFASLALRHVRFSGFTLRLPRWLSTHAAADTDFGGEIDVRVIFATGFILTALYGLMHTTPIGIGRGALIWAYHFFVSPLRAQGASLHDPLIGLSSVAVPDSLILTLLKALHAGPWPGGLFNLLNIFGLACFVAGAYTFVRLFASSRAAAVLATAMVLSLPLVYAVRFAAPFDLGPPLLVSAWIVRQRQTGVWKPLLVASLITGLLNTAGGFELALLLAAIRFSRKEKAGEQSYAAYGVAAIGSSVLSAYLLNALAAGMSLRQSWWSTDEFGRIFTSEGLAPLTVATILAGALALGGFAFLYGQRRTAALSGFGTLLALSALLALPVHFGGVPLLSPALVLTYLVPQGWPSGRFLELGVFAFSIPIASAFDVLLTQTRNAISVSVPRFAARLTVVVTLAASLTIVLGACRVAYDLADDPLGGIDSRARIVFFPQAQAGSYAGISYAGELLISGRPVLEPLVYAKSAPALHLGDNPSAGGTRVALERSRVDYAVIHLDFYDDPRTRTEGPELYAINARRHPIFSGVQELSLAGFTPDILIFRTPHALPQ